ncbi:MAG: outer membrane beta-barrel protein [Dyella sp.]
MNKLFTAALAASLAVASTVSFADSSTGDFFVNANLGQSQYRASAFNGFGTTGTSNDRNDTAGAVRFGYRWHSVVDYGVEVGYVDLGNAMLKSYFPGAQSNEKLSSRGYLLGGNLNYNINDSWYVSGRAGWYRSQLNDRVTTYSVVGNFRDSAHSTGTGEYAGVGVGYNISKAFSVGLNFDDYHSRANTGDQGALTTGMYSVSAEYRFW